MPSFVMGYARFVESWMRLLSPAPAECRDRALTEPFAGRRLSYLPSFALDTRTHDCDVRSGTSIFTLERFDPSSGCQLPIDRR
jgi:hypothetical protein